MFVRSSDSYWITHPGDVKGGLDADGRATDTRTNEQKVALLRLLLELKSRYPRALITSHHTFDAQKACPCFEAEREYGML